MVNNTDNTTIYSTPPLAGRPPFATDDDHLYDQEPQPAPRRLRQPPPPDPNARTSVYNVYDNYLDESDRNSGMASPGKGMMHGGRDDENPFDDRHRTPEPPRQQTIPIAAPRPGYAAPVAALNLTRPSPVASPEGRQLSPQMSQVPKPLTLVNNLHNRAPPPAAITVPSTPHPLPPTMTPITPVFARPAKPAQERGVKFAVAQPILRGEKEETLLPRRGERGDDFWRRFSMVVKEESSKRGNDKTSAWLRKTQNGTTRLSRWVWIIGMILLLCIAGGIGLGWWISHNNTSHTGPTAIGGSAGERANATSVAPAAASHSAGGAAPADDASSTFHVSPTRTVARRSAQETSVAFVPADAPLVDSPYRLNYTDVPVAPIRVQRSARHKRIADTLNRLD